MQSVSSRILICVAVSISYDDNHYTMGTSLRWPYTRLVKVEKQEETKMIQCLEVALYQCYESRMKKWFTEDLYLTLCIHLSHLHLSPSLHYFIHLSHLHLSPSLHYFIHLSHLHLSPSLHYFIHLSHLHLSPSLHYFIHFSHLHLSPSLHYFIHFSHLHLSPSLHYFIHFS